MCNYLRDHKMREPTKYCCLREPSKYCFLREPTKYCFLRELTKYWLLRELTCSANVDIYIRQLYEGVF